MRRVVLVVVVLLALPRPAHADLAGSVYEDVRDVIEELIRSEVTTSVVHTIETRSPALAFYMHGTLERLASPYWGSLGRTLEADLTVTVSDFVYWHLSTANAPGDIASSAKQFFGCVTNTGATTASAGCRRLTAALQTHRPLLEVECRRTKPAPERRVACDIGLATLAALERRGAVRHHVIDALADIVLAEIDDRALHDRLADLLARWLDHPEDLPTGLLDAVGNPDLDGKLSDDALGTLCDDPHTIETLLRDPAHSMGWLCFAVSHGSLPGALGAQVTIHDGGHTLDAHLDYWNIETALHDFNAQAASDDSSFRVLAELAFDTHCPAGSAITAWPCKGQRFAPGATITVAWLGREIAGTVGKDGLIATHPNRQMMLWLLRFRRAMKQVEELRALVPPSLAPYLFFPGSASPQSRSVLRSLARMARLAAELRARWYLWTQSSGSTSELDVVELLHVARAALGPELEAKAGNAADAAKQRVLGALGFLDRGSSGGDGGSSIDIGDWLRLVMRGDYRSLAMEALRAALDLHRGDTKRPREAFFVSLAAYLLDAGEGVDETVARSAFRAAAKDLLEATTRVGVPSTAHRFRLSAMPRLAMRISLSDDYAATGGNNRRTLVAADWPTAMVAISEYFGIEGSLIDPVAPLAELALRPTGSYHDQSYVALDALRPRFGVWVAVPALSRRLTLSAGVAARLVHVTREPTSDPMAVSARYSAHVAAVFDAGVQLVF